MTTETVDTSTFREQPTAYNTLSYNMVELLLPNTATPVAGGAGQTVEVDVVFDSTTIYPAIFPIDTNYTIQATPSQACAVSYTSKTTTGFSLILTPLNTGVTLSAGTVDLTIKIPNGAAQ